MCGNGWREAIIRAPHAPPSADWILGRNFGASAGAKRRGPGGEIYSREDLPPVPTKSAERSSASIPPALPPRTADIANLEVIDGRVVVIGAPNAARRADWILGRNFGASAGAKRRGLGGEIYSRGSASAGAERRGPGEEIYTRGPAPEDPLPRTRPTKNAPPHVGELPDTRRCTSAKP